LEISTAKTATISMRVSLEIKADAESVFSSLGMTLTEAINIFLHKSIMGSGLPFDVRQPRYNAETEAAMDEARAIIDGSVPAEPYDSPAAMFAALDEEARIKGHIGPIGPSAI
jgi:DNA-damage-inducible protein J